MKTKNEYQPKTGQACACRPGVERDNCPSCEGTGMRIDFKAIREKPAHTPTPWTKESSLFRDPVTIGLCADNQKKIIAKWECSISDSRQAHADAEFIVRAVNSHDELLGLVKAIVNDGIDDDWFKDAAKAIARAERGIL